MKYAKLATLFALPVAFAVTLGATPQPAEAGKACNELGLKSPCVRSSDVRPNLKLGKTGNDGDLIVRDEFKNTGFQVDGNTGDVTNSFDGNGLVKAWARIATDGSVITCFRCNMDSAETRKIPATTGQYEVDFTPLETDISSRPRLCISEKFAPTPPAGTDDNICNTSTSADPSTVNVHLWDGGVTPNTPENDQFTIIIF
jgi:hypothetical protein